MVLDKNEALRAARARDAHQTKSNQGGAVAGFQDPYMAEGSLASSRNAQPLGNGLAAWNFAEPPPRRGACGRCRAVSSYKFDNYIASRMIQVAGLTLVLSLSILLCGLLYMLTLLNKGTVAEVFGQAVWLAWTFMADPGTQAEAETFWERFLAGFISFVGIFFFAVILAFTVDTVRDKMDSLKKGTSPVVETGHTLILGFSDKAILVIKEVALANKSVGGGCVVVLGEEGKEFIQSEIHQHLRDSELHGTRVVCRHGHLLHSADLQRVAASDAKSIIVVSEGTDPDTADAKVLRVTLTLMGLPAGLNGHIVVECRDIDNAPLVNLVGGNCVETVVSHDIVGRLMLMSGRQPGLARVYSTLFTFSGDEFYSQAWPELVGVPFVQLLTCFEQAIPIGVETEEGRLILKPHPKRKMCSGDKLVVLAADEDTYSPLEKPWPGGESGPPLDIDKEAHKHTHNVEHILFCGWRRDVRDVILYLDELLVEGSEIHILSEIDLEEREEILQDQGLDIEQLRHITLVHHFGNSVVRRHLEALPIWMYNAVMIFADEASESNVMQADSHSIATLLLFRDIQKEWAKRLQRRDYGSEQIMAALGRWERGTELQSSIICEVLDPRTQQTIRSNNAVAQSSDFLQSNLLVSRILAMVSENRAVRTILDELLGSRGCDFMVRQSLEYVRPDEMLSFWEVAKRVQYHDEILCGYQRRRGQGIVEKTEINPVNKRKRKCWKGYDLVVLGIERLDGGDQDQALNVLDAMGGTDAESAKEHQDAVNRTVEKFAQKIKTAWTNTHRSAAVAIQSRYRGNEGRKRTAKMKEEEFDHIIDGFEFCEKIVAQVSALGPRAQNDVAHLFQVIASMCMDIATENSSRSGRPR